MDQYEDEMERATKEFMETERITFKGLKNTVAEFIISTPRIDEDQMMRFHQLKPRPIFFNPECTIDLEKDVKWGMDNPFQSISRIQQRRVVNAVVLANKYSSRNQREGHYNFKVNGRHTRKRKQKWPKIIQLTIGKALDEKIKALIAKKGFYGKAIT